MKNKYILFIFALLIILGCLCSCTKGWEDISTMPKQTKMYRISKWYELNWKFRDSSFVEVAYNHALLKYSDTTIFPITCPFSGIEVRYYK